MLNLEQLGWGRGRRASLVVAKSVIKRGEIHLRVNQIPQRILEGARQNLPTKINGNQLRAQINRPVTRPREVLVA
jgi:hypothetical protein